MNKHLNNGKVDALRLVPSLQGMNDRQIERLARLVDETAVDAGHVLMREGDIGREAFVIADGRAEVVIGGEVVCELGPGEVVGEMAMIDRRAGRTATVVAKTPMRLLAIGPSDFASFAGLPPVASAVVKTLATRLRAADRRIAELAESAEP